MANGQLMGLGFGLLTFLTLLGGCSSYNRDFDCGVGRGMPCSSPYKVDHAISRGEVDLELEAEQTLKNKQQKYQGPATYRTVWIAPKEDGHGNRHGEKYVTVKRP